MGRSKRNAGEGTVRLRKDGRWEGRVVIGYDENNLPKTKNVLAKSKMECLEKLDKLKEEWSKTTDKLESDMLFGEWIDYWYQTYSKPGIRETTKSAYDFVIYKCIIPKIGKIPLNKLTQYDLQQFYSKLKKTGRLTRIEAYGRGLSDRTVRACHASCRSALDKAVKEGLIKQNPSFGCNLPPKKAREMEVLSKDEIQRFLIQAKYEGYYELFILEIATGMRRGEILALKWNDLNFLTGELNISRQIYMVNGEQVISTPKTKSSIRKVILPPELLVVLSEYKNQCNSEWMFPSPINENSPRNPTAVLKRFKIILKRAECKTVRFHDLRHTFATMALENGMDIKTLSTLIGHVSSETTLNIYSHITDTMRQQAAVKIDRKIGGINTEIRPSENAPPTPPKNNESPKSSEFEPYTGKIRKRGTGCISKINDYLYEGRYSPRDASGKRISKNVYAHTREECEEKLAELIAEMKDIGQRSNNVNSAKLKSDGSW